MISSVTPPQRTDAWGVLVDVVYIVGWCCTDLSTRPSICALVDRKPTVGGSTSVYEFPHKHLWFQVRHAANYTIATTMIFVLIHTGLRTSPHTHTYTNTPL